MDKEMKELRKRVKAYFGNEKCNVKAFCYMKYKCFDVEYEDFEPESKVETDIRKIIGDDYLLNVKREYSDELIIEMAQRVIQDMPYQESLNVLRKKPDYYDWMANYSRAM